MSEGTHIYITVGAPAAGKSTWIASQTLQSHEVVSSDSIREMVCGDAANQSVNAAAWDVVHSLIRAKLLAREPVVVLDSTAARLRDRKKLLTFVRTWMTDNSRVIGVVFAPQLTTLIERDSVRERQVGAEGIQKYYERLRGNPPSLGDGFDELYVLNNDAQFKGLPQVSNFLTISTLGLPVSP